MSLQIQSLLRRSIRVYKTFIQVAESRHFGRAAENLYITQAAVSARIKQLEEFYDKGRVEEWTEDLLEQLENQDGNGSI